MQQNNVQWRTMGQSFHQKQRPPRQHCKPLFCHLLFRVILYDLFQAIPFLLAYEMNFLPNLAYFEKMLAHKINRFYGSPLGGLQEL